MARGIEGRGRERHGGCPVLRGHLPPAGRSAPRPGEDPGRERPGSGFRRRPIGSGRREEGRRRASRSGTRSLGTTRSGWRTGTGLTRRRHKRTQQVRRRGRRGSFAAAARRQTSASSAPRAAPPTIRAGAPAVTAFGSPGHRSWQRLDEPEEPARPRRGDGEGGLARPEGAGRDRGADPGAEGLPRARERVARHAEPEGLRENSRSRRADLLIPLRPGLATPGDLRAPVDSVQRASE